MVGRVDYGFAAIVALPEVWDKTTALQSRFAGPGAAASDRCRPAGLRQIPGDHDGNSGVRLWFGSVRVGVSGHVLDPGAKRKGRPSRL